MWSRLTRGGDGLPREKVDAIVRLIDRYLAEEASLRNLQSDKQTIHPRDLPPDKREALIEEVFEILNDTRSISARSSLRLSLVSMSAGLATDRPRSRVRTCFS